MSDNPFGGSAANDNPFGGYGGGGGGSSEQFSPNASDGYSSGKKNADVEQPQQYDGNTTVLGVSTAIPTDASLAEREANLLRRERELEAKLARYENGGDILRPKNYPPCYPLIYHDINAEVEFGRRTMVRVGFIIWNLEFCAWFYNSLVATVLFFADDKIVGSFSLVIAYMANLIGWYVSWFLWYRNLFAAGVSNRALRYIFFFIHFLAHTMASGFITIGPPTIGEWAQGMFNMIDAFNKSNGLGIFVLINFLLWAVITASSFYLLFLVYAEFRGGGAQREAQNTAAAASVAASAAGAAQESNASSGGFY